MGDEIPGKLTLALITGSRADYGHLRMLAKVLAADSAFAASIIVTASHLSPRFGRTVEEIERDGFNISARVALALDDDSPAGVAASVGSAVTGLTAAFTSQMPEAVIVYGDRWEMLAAALAATLCGIPLVHIGGGDVTEGAYDEGFRHAITKMSHLHFVTHDEARRRVLQLGEDPARVFTTGSLAVDAIKCAVPLRREEWERAAGFELQPRNLLVTYHPTTLERDAEAEVGELLAALAALPDDVGILFTQPSMDKGALGIAAALEAFIAKRRGAKLVASLGHRLYTSAIALFDAVVGNSSSGLYEVPSFGKPTVNIGNRQGGRLKAASVIDVPVECAKIRRAILQALESNGIQVENPYGDGRAAEKMAEILKSDSQWRSDLKKTFFRFPG